jgi:hypothetical protein
MWKGSESVMHALECVGLIEKVRSRDVLLEAILLLQWAFFFVVLLFLGFVCAAVVAWNVCRFVEMVLHFVDCLLRDITRFLLRLPDFFSARPGEVPSQIHTAAQFARPSLDHVMEIKRLVNMAEEIQECAGRDVPTEYLCPIGLSVMTVPVIACTGHTFELDNLDQWLQNSENKCPLTRQETRPVARNLILEKLIEEWAKGVIAQWEKDLPPPAPEQDSVSICTPAPEQDSVSISPPASERDFVSIFPPARQVDSLSSDLMVELRHVLNRRRRFISGELDTD